MKTIVYSFSHSYGLMDNISGMLVINLLCKLKNYVFKYETSNLNINFKKYLFAEYVCVDNFKNYKHCQYINIPSTQQFLQELYYNSFKEEVIVVKTNLQIYEAYKNIFDMEYIKSFIFENANKLINFNIKINNLKNNYIAIHFRFGDKYINDNNVNQTEENFNKIKELALKTSSKILLNNTNKILLVGDNHNIIQYIINNLDSANKNNIYFNNSNCPKHFSNINTEKELDFLMCDVYNLYYSKKNYFIGLGPGAGFAFLTSLMGNVPYERV